jgi:hypothetical protein
VRGGVAKTKQKQLFIKNISCENNVENVEK